MSGRQYQIGCLKAMKSPAEARIAADWKKAEARIATDLMNK